MVKIYEIKAKKIFNVKLELNRYNLFEYMKSIKATLNNLLICLIESSNIKEI